VSRRGRDARAVKHTLAVSVENKPGALTRITSMFARRGYNIESLAVGPTERPDVSRITLRVDCEQHSLEQIEKQMHKLVNVLRVSELEPDQALERELALIKVAATPDRRAARAAGACRPETAEEGAQWPRSTAKVISTCSPARSPCSATGARATRTRSTCATPASRSRSACARAAPRRRPRRRPGFRSPRSPR